MDKLKDFIGQHREEFETGRLPEGSWERFARRLETESETLPQPRRNPFSRRLYLWITAAAACMALFWITQPASEGITDPMVLQAAEMTREMEEMQLYYNMQMENIVGQMEEIHRQYDNPATRKLLSESQRILDKNTFFQKDVVPSLPRTDNGLSAINQYYTCHLNSLNQMLEYMKEFSK